MEFYSGQQWKSEVGESLGGVKTGHSSKVGASPAKQAWVWGACSSAFLVRPLRGTSCSTGHREHSESLLRKCKERVLKKGSSAPGTAAALALLAKIHRELRSLPCQFLWRVRVGTSNILTSSFENSLGSVKMVLADCCLLGCLVVCSLDTWLRSPLKGAGNWGKP